METTSNPKNKQALFGVGLRKQHFPRLSSSLETSLDFFEVVSENHLAGGRPRQMLEHVASRYPLAFHGVGLNIGAPERLNRKYIKRLKSLLDVYTPLVVSDHLCWTGIAQRQLHNLLPLPYTPQTLSQVVERIKQAQDLLERRLAFENVSAYFTWSENSLSESAFLAEMAERADCLLLLDLNNLYINAVNQDFDASAFLRELPAERVVQYHLAGYSDQGTFLFDTHAHAVYPAVWSLYREALACIGIRPTLVEWDEEIPAFEILEAEALKARQIWETGV